MVVVKVIRHPNTGSKYLENACKYPPKKEECIYIRGYGVDYHNLEYAYEQMMHVKEHFSKTSGNQLIHIIVSFGNTVYDDKTAIEMGEKIAVYYSGKYQLIWGIHKLTHGESMYHMHIIINSVSYIDGKMFDSYYNNMIYYCYYIEQVINDNFYLEFQSN